MTTVNIVNSLPTPSVSQAFTIIDGNWTQTTRFGLDTATATGGSYGSATARTLQRVDPLLTVPEYGYVPFFSVSAQSDLRLTNPTVIDDTIQYNIGGSGSASASLALEIPGILDCSYTGSVSTTALNTWPNPNTVSTYSGTFSLTFLGVTTTTTDVPLGGYNGWFPGSVIGRVPLKITVSFGEVYSPGTVICVATLQYPYTNYGSYAGTTTYELVLGALDGITGTETATPGSYDWSISASHYETASSWTYIPSGDPYLELVDTRVYVGEPLPPPVTPGVDVRGVSVELCGPAPC